jgi:hypothetical protein
MITPRLCRTGRPLADHGDAKAQSYLDLVYAQGRGVAQDYAEAVKWYRKAADQRLVMRNRHPNFVVAGFLLLPAFAAAAQPSPGRR